MSVTGPVVFVVVVGVVVVNVVVLAAAVGRLLRIITFSWITCAEM
jgi:hypothetical protein